MFDIASLILGVILGAALGVAVVSLIIGGKQDDDEAGWWVDKLGRRVEDKRYTDRWKDM
jgi:hypothetical protein